MPGSVDVEVRVARVGAVVLAHHLAVPDVAHARAECSRLEAMFTELGRPAAVLMLPDRVLPPATVAVREIYRESAERSTGRVGIWSAVVGGVMGFAASIATSMAEHVFARRPIPIRIFRTVPPALEWMRGLMDLEAEPAEVLAAIERLRNPTFIRKVG